MMSSGRGSKAREATPSILKTSAGLPLSVAFTPCHVHTSPAADILGDLCSGASPTRLLCRGSRPPSLADRRPADAIPLPAIATLRLGVATKASAAPANAKTAKTTPPNCIFLRRLHTESERLVKLFGGTHRTEAASGAGSRIASCSWSHLDRLRGGTSLEGARQGARLPT